ncbi:MAG: hypothetical protein JO277_00235 [Candidatus Eremiobacteraeota bacterium]|nr:hypothetical protein [Candidatus Eremiobacteraeota bacterium]
MYYVEMLYARSRMLWYIGITGVLALTFLYFVAFPPAGAHVRNEGQDVPMDPIFIGASFAASIMASMLAATLNRDQSHLAYMWTRPLSRVRIALNYIVVDIVTILLAYGWIVGLCFFVLSVPPLNHPIPDSQSIPILLRGIAVPLMLYAVVEVATSWSPQRLGAAIGIFWGAGWTSLILGEINLPVIGPLLRVINLFNPIAYFPDYHSHGVNVNVGPEIAHTSLLSFDFQTGLAYAICTIALIVATYNWKRMEA